MNKTVIIAFTASIFSLSEAIADSIQNSKSYIIQSLTHNDDLVDVERRYNSEFISTCSLKYNNTDYNNMGLTQSSSTSIIKFENIDIDELIEELRYKKSKDGLDNIPDIITLSVRKDSPDIRNMFKYYRTNPTGFSFSYDKEDDCSLMSCTKNDFVRYVRVKIKSKLIHDIELFYQSAIKVAEYCK